MKARLSVSIVAALVALTVSLVAFGGAPGAVATQGSAIIAGHYNDETDPTTVDNVKLGSPSCFGTFIVGTDALVACGVRGVLGEGQTGVVGEGASGGTGVFGQNSGSTGIGVEGDTGGSGSGVYGHATANGVGVFGDTTNGSGVIARSTNGNALDVRGKALFSRSGVATVPSGAKKIVVTMSGVTTSSMVLATVQQSGAFYVKNVTPASGSFTIFINKAPASPATVKVAYFVLN